MTAKFTKEKFLKCAEFIHKNRYDYSLVEYQSLKSYIKIICKIHGAFDQLAGNHLKGNGCAKCAGRNKTIEDFVALATITHGNKYDYTYVNKINAKIKIKILCHIHGEFYQLPGAHLKGSGCKKCVYDLKRSNTDEFIEKAKIIHSNKYCYNKSNYIDSNVKVIITCNLHGDFMQKPNCHLSGNGCPKCNGAQRLTDKEFIDKANSAHDNKYNYSKVIYINNKTKITIICNKHGEFKQAPDKHLLGNGCPKCAKESLSKLYSFTKDEFIECATKFHGNKYDYSSVDYINAKTKIKIICKIHGEFMQTPGSHLKYTGCTVCSGRMPLNTASFIKRAIVIHNNKYDYSKSNFTSSRDKLDIICKLHGLFKQQAGHHLQGHGCPKCSYNTSKPEIAWLDFLGIPKEFRNKTIWINNRHYYVDAIVGTTIYEFYGDYWHGNPIKYNFNEINNLNKRKFGELYQATIERERIFKEAGYNIINIWEDDWKKLKITSNQSKMNLKV